MKNIVVFSGAGISAESGLKTFRDSDGLWEEYNVAEVATPEAWDRDRELVLEFYNKRRKQMLEATPNPAHHALVKLEEKYNVQIVTQNIDNLHERAGSTQVLHLHGQILKSRSTANPSLIYDIEGWELNKGDRCELGSQLRPHIVWFGEEVPNMERAAELCSIADILIIVGTSLNVYPAAGLVHYTPEHCKKYLVDPSELSVNDLDNLTVLQAKASEGIPIIAQQLLAEFSKETM